jgi:hypothetical protein
MGNTHALVGYGDQSRLSIIQYAVQIYHRGFVGRKVGNVRIWSIYIV